MYIQTCTLHLNSWNVSYSAWGKQTIYKLQHNHCTPWQALSVYIKYNIYILFDKKNYTQA